MIATALPRSWSARRVATTIVLATWAFLFWFLIIDDRTSLYLSSRTAWVVPVGAVILTIATVGRFASARTSMTEEVTRRDALTYAVLVMPVVVVLALPPASLSSFAATRRSSLTGAGFVSNPADVATGDLSLADVAGAVRTDEGKRALATRAGEDVDFVGFVTREEGMPADEFVLTRFMISCCVADALSVEVRVAGAPPGRFKEDEWVRVEGQIYPVGHDVVVDASSVTKVPRPDSPYLNP